MAENNLSGPAERQLSSIIKPVSAVSLLIARDNANFPTDLNIIDYLVA